MTALLVALGGALGSLARHGIGTAVAGPWPVVGVNCLGSLLLGLLVGLPGVGDQVRTALGVGLLGGFTTYSTFAVQVVTDVDAGRPGRAAAYLGLSLAGGLVCAAAGYAAGRAVAG